MSEIATLPIPVEKKGKKRYNAYMQKYMHDLREKDRNGYQHLTVKEYRTLRERAQAAAKVA